MDAQTEVKVTMSSPSVSETTPPPTLAERIEVKLEFDPSLSEDERRFYVKAYPSVEMVRERKVHCTVCKLHLGTAPNMDNEIKMHPILRVTHCPKCHDFYNSGEFSKGEDGSELYCRWCGQGGEVYCCANCPYVFCKSCIVKNLSRGVVADIEQNENWSCFSCAPKILWPLRAQHWALMNYIEKQKITIQALNLSEPEVKMLMERDRSSCCRLSKDKPTNLSESVESVDCTSPRRSQSSYTSISAKKPLKPSQAAAESPAAKRPKTSNDEVVCTPDLLSMLEPDCQITVSSQARQVPTPSASTPRVLSIQPGYRSASAVRSNNTTPPPLVLRNTSVQMRPVDVAAVARRAVVGPRPPNPVTSNTPVYHTINGYRIDLNSAAQQDTFRLPNGKLIQVKRQGTQQQSAHNSSWQQRSPAAVQQQPNSARPVQISQATPQSRYQTITIQPPSNSSHMSRPTPQVMHYHNSTITSNGGAPITINGAPTAPIQSIHSIGRPLMVRHTFPETAIGQARSQLQDQVFGASDICNHLISKVLTLTNSNAYKQAHSYLDVKELYIHLSYLMTYAIGRFKGLQDKCLGDMRQLGFVNDADSLENGQLAADKQASDDEDNDIEIVEPKTDTITLDSDNDDEVVPKTEQRSSSNINESNENVEIMSVSQSVLANILELDVTEGDQGLAQGSPNSSEIPQKKQPRKKTTNKPNPTLIRQKEILERERLEEMKRSDLKLKMKCAVELKKAEEEFPFAMEMIEKNLQETLHTDGDTLKELKSETLHNGSEDAVEDKEHRVHSVADEMDHKSVSVIKRSLENTEAPENKSSKSDGIVEELIISCEKKQTLNIPALSIMIDSEKKNGKHTKLKTSIDETAVVIKKESQEESSIVNETKVIKSREDPRKANGANAKNSVNVYETEVLTFINGEPDLDVDKEIEKLLKNKNEERLTNNISIESTTALMPAEQNMLKTTIEVVRTAKNSSPAELFDNIKELIYGHTNSMS